MTRILEIRKGILQKNDLLAAALRERFASAGVLAVNLVSSPGTGKTALLQQTLRRLADRRRNVATLVGDLETDNDARRLAGTGTPVRQINTHGVCHLDAAMVEDHLEAWAGDGLALGDLEYLFIENVGNLVCPAGYDLGEALRIAMVSVTEGEDKPLKYPRMFHSADTAVVTKLDLAAACECNLPLLRENLEAIRPGIRVFEVSTKTGEGLDVWIQFLELAQERQIAVSRERVASSGVQTEGK